MRKEFFALVCALAITVPASAEELWAPHMMGADTGIATGALPPPGFYFLNTAIFAPWKVVSGSQTTGTNADVFVEVPQLLWTTPLTVFGASYAVGIAQPWSQIDLRPDGQSVGAIARSNFFNTIVTPGILSWNLPENLHLSTGLNVYVPNGTWSNPLTHPAGNLNSNGYWTFEPSVAVSWLKNGWNVSLKAYYDANLKDNGLDYKSGDIFGTEETVSKEIGKWTVGVSGFTQNQIANDTGTAVALVNGPQAAIDGNRIQNFGAGPLLGYDFGPVKFTASYFHTFDTRNHVAGSFVYARLIVPIK